ncbi:lantibiotic dehydratase [Streptomyces lasalocidi]
MTGQATEHVVPLGNSGWYLWRDVMLRGAGFPALQVLELSDPTAAAAADALLAGTGKREAYDQAFRDATGRLSATVRVIASNPQFREAVAWQNRRLLTDCLDKAAAGEPRNARGRNHERAITSYFQRYTTKNDTIGFFGPVGWAAWTDGTDAMTVTPGPGLLTARNVYFESWAIDAIAQALSGREQLRPWLSPRIDSAHRLIGPVVLRPGKDSLCLNAPEAVLLELCDGRRTVRELARHPRVAAHPDLRTEAAVLDALELLQKQGVIALDWEGPVEARPEDTLRAKLERIGDAALRNEALDVLGDLCRARDTVAAAAGDAHRLATALDNLNDVFVAVTGTEAVRRHGQNYSRPDPRVRGHRASGGGRARRAPARGPRRPSDSHAQQRALAGEPDRRRVHDTVHRHPRAVDSTERHAHDASGADARGGDTSPLLLGTRIAVPRQERGVRPPVPLAAGPRPAGFLHCSSSLQRRTGRALSRRVPGDPARAWAAAIHHSPDIMLAAASPEAVRAGDYVAVLGELHTALNTLESRVCVEQHPAPGRLRAADNRDHGNRRIYLVPPKDWPTVTSRLAPPSALLCRDYTYWTLRTPSAEPRLAP